MVKTLLRLHARSYPNYCSIYIYTQQVDQSQSPRFHSSRGKSADCKSYSYSVSLDFHKQFLDTSPLQVFRRRWTAHRSPKWTGTISTRISKDEKGVRGVARTTENVLLKVENKAGQVSSQASLNRVQKPGQHFLSRRLYYNLKRRTLGIQSVKDR